MTELNSLKWDAHSVGRPCADCLLWDWRVAR